VGVATYRRGCYAAAFAAVAFTLVAQQLPDSSTRRRSGQPLKTILAMADVSTDSYQHDSISHAVSIVEDLGLRAGLYDTVIRTDPQLVTRGAIAAATGTLTFYRNLDDFDAIVWFASGEPALDAQQKKDLLSFVRAGRGLVVLHSGVGAFPSWPEFAEMIGGRIEEHAEAVKESEVTVLDAQSAAMKLFPKRFRIRDNFSPVELQKDARVLATSKTIPVVWTKKYGRGRVFVSQFGHLDAVWDRPDIRNMVFEAIRWAISGQAELANEVLQLGVPLERLEPRIYANRD
jgi:type 1 glutamine amidotransferase